MRWRGFVAVCALLLGSSSAVSGCKGDEKGASKEAVKKVAAASTQMTAEEDDILARRDALFKARNQILTRRTQLRVKYDAVRAAGGDTSDLDAKAQALVSEESKLISNEASLNKKYEAIIAQRRKMMTSLQSGTGPAAQLAGREAGIASREKSLARRESRVAEREQTLAKREAGLAKREKETCGVGAPTTIIRTVASPRGAKYSKRDVEPLLKKARRRMSRKGILRSDLSAPAQGLEREATKAMREADYGRARFAAAQLVATVNSIRIGKAFIAAKIGRLSQRMKGKKLSASKRKEVDRLFNGAIAAHGDGRFSRANRNLNRIYAAIR